MPTAPVAALMTWAATTAASPMMKPIDRSMPPEMMTKVWPIASKSGATAKIAIDCRLKGLRMNVPPKSMRAQASKHEDQRGEKQPGAQVGDALHQRLGAVGMVGLRLDVRVRGRCASVSGVVMRVHLLRRRARARREKGSIAKGWAPRNRAGEPASRSVGVDVLRHVRIGDVGLVDHGEAGADRGRDRLAAKGGRRRRPRRNSRSRPDAGRSPRRRDRC